MRRIEKITLHFREGKSDKVYEVDLCEVGPDRYVVNFRYGRRGAQLRDGTKTLAPVPLPEARKIYRELVDSKVQKGYQEGEPSAAEPSAPRTPAAAPAARPGRLDKRRRRVLELLEEGGGDDWPLERVVWRAGELRIPQASPLLAELAGSGDELQDYCVAWALGRCGGARAVEPLRRLVASGPARLRPIAMAALLQVSESSDRPPLLQALSASLPSPLSTLVVAGPVEDTVAAAREALTPTEPSEPHLSTLYLLNTPAARPALLDAVDRLPLKRPCFQGFRHVFKLAEFRSDGQVFGRIAHRFEITPANPAGWDDSPQSTPGYTSNTRRYLRQRVWRTLRRLGELKDPAYVPMAVGVLAPFTDADMGQQLRLWAFNHLLYSRGRRLRPSRRAWHRDAAQPPVPTTREEAFPELWDAQPTALLHLVSESRCLQVHQFAALALRSLRDFCASLPVDAVVMLLAAPYEPTIRLGFDLAAERYRPGAPPEVLRDLALAVSNCSIPEIRAHGYQWIRNNPDFLRDAVLLVGLILSPVPETRDLARALLGSATLDEGTGRALVVGLVAHLMAMGPGQEAEAADLSATLLQSFGTWLGGIGLPVIEDLAGHPLAAAQELAAHLLLVPAAPPPSEKALAALLDSEHEAVRRMAARVLGRLDDASLLQREDLLWPMISHRDPEMRDALRPTLARLVQAHPEFGERFLQRILAGLLRRKLAEGVPEALVQILAEDFAALLPRVPTDVVWRLLRSGSSAAAALGAQLLPGRLEAATTPVEQMVELADHEDLAVRRLAWELLEQSVERLKAEIGTAVGVLDSRWEDTRSFAFRLFETRFGPGDFTPEVLVSICDSVRPDVQRFGRDRITAHFEERHGPEYLQKLSEHPSADVQLFVTNYLDRYAAGSPEMLQRLEGYFVRTLGAINRGRAARKRIHAFLRAEAMQSEESARVVASVMGRQSAAVSIEERAAAIETLALIARRWPSVPVPLRFRAPEVRTP